MMFFEQFKEYESMRHGLSRLKNFLKLVNNPQDKLKVVHISGTNGKGSTAVFISEILKTAGYKTALYTSPHLIDITERIKINGKNISSKDFENLSRKHLKDALKYKLSYFEYLTALAFIYFVRFKVDIAVLETGLGGRFDATNVVKKKLVCVITSIGKDHEEILGSTIKKIAFEKAGIIKKNAYVVCGKLSRIALNVIKNKVSPYLYGKDFKTVNHGNIKYAQRFDYVSKNFKLQNIDMRLLGEHQTVNAAVALCVVRLLNKKGYRISQAHIRTGLKNAVWPGRFDIRKIKYGIKNFKLIIDGAHNVEGFDAFFNAFKRLGFSKRKKKFIFAIMREKGYKRIVKKIIPFAKEVILPWINNNRAINTNVLKLEFSKYIAKNKILTVDSLENAFNTINNGETAVAVGSLYLAGEILNRIRGKDKMFTLRRK